MVVRIALLLLVAVVLTHQDEPEVTIDGDQEQFIAKGENVTLICRYNISTPVSEVQWIKDGELIAINSTVTNNGSRLITAYFNDSLSQLSIASVSSQDSGIYTCNVTNEVNNTAASTSIDVQEKLSTKLQPETVTVKEGENVTLFCNSSGSSLTITWQFNGSDVTTFGDSRISFSIDNKSLIITNVSRKQKGEYKCVARNKYGDDTSNIAVVSVEFEPEVSIDGDQEQFKAKGENFTLICRYNSSPPVSEVQWIKDGKVIAVNSTATKNESRVTITHYHGSLSQLSIATASSQDSGTYTCNVTNELNSTTDSTSIVIQVAPKVTIDGDQMQYAINGTDLQLTCRFNASPPVSEVRWLKDGTVVASTLTAPSNGTRLNISHHNESLAQLSIKTVSLEDSGNYTCNVTNSVGISSNWTSVVIQVTPLIETNPQAGQVNEGGNLTLFCNASGSSSTILWTRNGSGVNPNEDTRIILSADNEQLTITNVSRTDNGAYQCVAGNNVGNDTSNAAVVTIQFKPEISQAPSDTTKVVGLTAVLSCLVAGYPAPNVAWTKDDVELIIAANSRLNVFSKYGNHSLTLKNVQQLDAGKYRCVGSNSLGNSTSSPATLTVHFPPEVTIDGDKIQYVINGTDLLLTCQFNALPPVSELRWVKDGILIASTFTAPLNGSQVNISHYNESLALLSIKKVSLEDSGNYTCNVTNSVGSSSDETSIIVQVTPTIEKDPKAVTVKEGENLTLFCDASGSSLKLSWRKNGSVVDPSDDSRIHLMADNEQLIITNVTRTDNGAYWCVVSNEVGNATSNATIVAVQFAPVFLDPWQPNINIIRQTTEGNAYLAFSCTVEGNPSPLLYWTKNGEKLNVTANPRLSAVSWKGIHSLNVLNLTRLDAGFYRCVAVNDVGKAASHGENLRVNFAPEIFYPPQDATRLEGQGVIFNCTVDGDPPPSVTWTRNKEELKVGVNSRLLVSSTGSNHSLEIKDVQRSDAGQYRCVASNRVGNSSSFPASLIVQYAPEVTTDGDQIQYVANGIDIQLTCRFNALPSASEVQWVKDGIVIASTLTAPSNESRVNISHHGESRAQLSIRAVSLEDSGNYTCNVTNNVDSSSNWTSIIVQVTPAIETDPKAIPVKEGENLTLFCNASGSSLTISWTKYGLRISLTEDSRIFLSVDNKLLTISNVSRKDSGAYQCVASNNVGDSSSNFAIVTVRVSPEISFSSTDNTEVEGGTADFWCMVAGYPTPDVAWTKNGVELNVAANVRLSVFDYSPTFPGYHGLTISKVQQSDAGEYRCEANNSLDTATSSPATLTIHFDPEVTIDDGKELFVAKGDDIKITCRYSALPPVSGVLWIKDGTVISSNSSKVLNNSRMNIVHFNVSLVQLSINAVIMADSGNYSCSVTNKVDTTSDWTSISIEEKPSIVTHPQSVAPKEGDTFALRCNATGSPLLHIFWTFDGSFIVENESSTISLSNDSQELTITNVKRGDSGEYRCVVKNRVGNDTSNPSVVNVLYRADVKIGGSEPKFVEISKQIQLTCLYNASPPVFEVQWVKDGIVIARNYSEISNGQVNIIQFTESQSQLLISSSTREDGGHYACFVTNAIGNSSDITSVVIQVDPSPPQNITVGSKGSRVIDISWNSGFKGNSAVKNYTVEISEDNQNFNDAVCQGSLSSSTCVVSSLSTAASLMDLLPWTTYSIRVFATNKIGRSNSSHILNVTTNEEEPGAPPQNVQAYNTGSTSINITWIEVRKDKQHGDIILFTVLYKKATNGAYEKVEVFEKFFELKGLDKYIFYDIKVAAATRVGNGPASDPIKVRTDEDVPSVAPIVISLQTLNSTSIQVKWRAVPEESIHGIPTRYTIYLTYSDGKVNTKVVRPVKDQNTYQEVVSGLKEFTEYSVQDSLSTAKGEGPLSVSKSSATERGCKWSKKYSLIVLHYY